MIITGEDFLCLRYFTSSTSICFILLHFVFDAQHSFSDLIITMALPIPATLKNADIARFALRAGQLEKMEPVIAYWCMSFFSFETKIEC